MKLIGANAAVALLFSSQNMYVNAYGNIKRGDKCAYGTRFNDCQEGDKCGIEVPNDVKIENYDID